MECKEEDCYNCDNFGKRWYLSKEDDLRLKRKGLVKAMERYKRQIDAIDAELAELEKPKDTNTP